MITVIGYESPQCAVGQELIFDLDVNRWGHLTTVLSDGVPRPRIEPCDHGHDYGDPRSRLVEERKV